MLTTRAGRIVLATTMLIVLGACASEDDDDDAATDTTEAVETTEATEPEATEPETTEPDAETADDRPGSPEVYDRIEAATDCPKVQAEFDQASTNNYRAEPGTEQFDITLSYMEAADARLEELGCYD